MKGSKKEDNKGGRQGNIYDRIFKENAEYLFIPIIEEELGLKIKRHKTLTDKLPKTVEREVDFLYEVTLEDDNEWVLHIEFQTKDSRNMIYRMGMYHGLVWEKYKKPIKHIVIYLGKGNAKMRSKLTEQEIFRGFDLINLHQLDTEKLLSSQVPEVIMLAILSNYKQERGERIMRLVIEGIRRSTKKEETTTKYLEQLIILSRLRNLEEETIKIIEDMPITYDIKKDGLYKRGVEHGMGIALVVIKCLNDGMDYNQIQIKTGLSIEQIKEIEKLYKGE